MAERAGAVTIHGKPFTLIGDELKVGARAPDVELTGNDMKPVKVSDFRGRVVVVSVVHSLDTGICDAETRRFNKEAGGLGGATVLTVSRDLPFAQKRWCGAAGVDQVVTASDYRDGSFGRAWGVEIKELALHARSVFVVDKEGVVRYAQLVKEVASEPDYAPILEAVKKLA